MKPKRTASGARFATVLLAAGLTGHAAEETVPPVALPAGETRLAEIGTYRVGWQSYGGPTNWLPLSWAGHFDDATGVACEPAGTVLGREAWFLHSPWRVPAGRTWVDYPLQLPAQKPIQLRFGTAMGPDAVQPGKSDGVTFSCAVLADGQKRELLRQHQTIAAWRDYAFDLSTYAGRTVTLRLQVEPGPKNNPSFDFSYFGDATLRVGNHEADSTTHFRAFLQTPAYRATKNVSRLALRNVSDQGVTPSNLLPCTNSLVHSGNRWEFTYAAADTHLTYRYVPATGTLDDFTAIMEQRSAFQPARGGGVSVTVTSNQTSRLMALRGGHALRTTAKDNQLTVRWQYEFAGKPLIVTWTFDIQGKALVVSAQCDDPVLSQMSLGAIGPVPFRRSFPVPYLDGLPSFLPAQGAFVFRQLDWTVSHASRSPQGIATYDTKTDGTRNPLFERGYIAVSPDLDEVLPNLPNPPSPYRATLAPRVMLDIWGHDHGMFAGDAAKLRELKDNGVDHLAIIQHDWQHFGYDVKLPDHMPANERYGGDAGLRQFGQTANDCGYLWALHENYIDLYPDAPSYDPAARVLRADGTPSPAWFNSGTGVQSFGLKCNRALDFARQNSLAAHAHYGTTAAYLDVHTCVPPWHELDHDASQPMAAMALLKVQRDTALFQFERDTHGGPLFGEGANHFYWAGRCDGVEAQVHGGEDHAPLLDFDLLKIHPQMVNHGMGYLERWFRRGYDAQFGFDAGSVEQFDKYRAMELAYGHAGFLGNRLVHTVQAVAREHHLMHPVQRLYGTSAPVEISYEVDGQFVTVSAALIAGDTSRQRIRYANGLTLWVNWRAEPWSLHPPAGPPTRSAQSYLLPQWGFLALGPDTEVYTGLHVGRVADFASCPEYIFADARTRFDQPYLPAVADIEPRLSSFRYLGGNRIEVTYVWHVNAAPGGDYHCFVHALNAAQTKGEHIVFQGDHTLPQPTSQWHKGDVITDGPHVLDVSAAFDHYDLTIGLYRDERLRLKGAPAPGNRVLLGELNVARQNGTITNITFQPATLGTQPEGAVTPANFTAHTNPDGTWIDFGLLATDGAVKINRAPGQLVIFPYPRDKAFHVNLDMKQLLPGSRASAIEIHALATKTQADLGSVPFTVHDGKLRLTLGMPGAGRYTVTWK